MYEIKYHPLVVSIDIPKISTRDVKVVKNAIERKLKTSPDVFGISLRHNLKGYKKIRVGDYRVIFRIKEKKVLIDLISHRRDVYILATKRLSMI